MGQDASSRVAGLSPAKRALLEELRKGRRETSRSAIPARPRGESLPLSFAQQRLWFIHQIEPGSPAYNVPVALRLRGRLDPARLESALTRIVHRHETLRTRFLKTADGPRQTIDPPGPVSLPIVDLSSGSETERMTVAERLAGEEAAAPFDLERDAMLRVRLLRLAEEDHVFLATMHHVASDGWSLGVFVRELAEHYEAERESRAPRLPDLSIQYADFAAWQRESLSGDALESELDHWRARLHPPAPPLELPADHPRPPVQTFRGGVETVSIDARTVEALRRLAGAEGATLFMTLVAAFDALLSRLTGETDLVIGTGIANRTRPELEPLIGFFVNALALRLDVSGDPTFREIVGRAREVTLDAFAHQDLPFERLVEELQPTRDLSRNPLFQSAIALQNAPLEDFELPGLSVSPVPSPNEATRFDLEFHLWENDSGGLDGFLFHSRDLFEARTARRLTERFAVLLASAAQDPDLTLSRLKVTCESDDREREAHARGPDLDVPPTPVVRRFEEWARRTPDALALEAPERRLTYAELDRAAERLASRLRARGVGCEDRVGVLADRCVEQVIAVVAVAKTGAAWVPLDPANPPPRRARMIESSGVRIVLTRGPADALPRSVETIPLDVEGGTTAEDPPCGPEIHPSQVAYVIFTSGSTGEPRGVEVTQENLAGLVEWHRSEFSLDGTDRTTLLAGVGFDASVWELWPALASGASLFLPDETTRLDADRLVRWLVERRITIAFLPTPIAEGVLRREWPESPALRTMLTGGDRLHAVAPTRIPFRVVNNYGPTEATVVATSGDVDGGGSRPFPTIGRPIANTAAHVLDARLRPVPPGVAGELWIGGAGVARGYAGQPALTADRFRPDPFTAQPGARLYRTGDRVRTLPDGRLEFLGRIDDQVKIRGQRVEPGEAEAILRNHPRVRTAAVVPRTVGERSALVAYVVIDRADAEDDLSRREHVDRWRDLYDATYGATAEDADASFNIIGWDSSYTGEPLPPEEMREWRDETVERVLSLQPRRVLEIGCGTGLLLTRIAPAVERYVATDLSAAALAQVRRLRAGRPDLGHVELHQRRAHEAGAEEPGSFDTVILNSVVQYFPDAAYLERVVERAMELLAEGGRLFVGDVRDLRLHRAFAASVERTRRPDASVGAVRSLASLRLEREEELLLHPGWFARAAARHARPAWARALVKRGRSDNELTRFRYDVVVELSPPPYPVEPCDDLESAMRSGRAEIVRRHLPNARLTVPVDIEREIFDGARTEAIEAPIHPDDLREVAARRGYDAVAGLSADPARFDVAFVRGGAPPAGLQTPLPEDDVPLANEPVQVTRAAGILPELREHAAAALPETLVPTAFVLLDEMPLTRNGKIDRRALPEPEELHRPAGPRVPPRTATERTIARIWSDVLGLEEVCATDDFFELGGHSLLATQVLARIRTRLQVSVPLRIVFEASTVEQLARWVDDATVEAPTTSSSIPRAPRDREIPLSLAQQRLWFIDRLESSPAYHIPNALRLRGPLDADALARALRDIIARHEALRTRFPDGRSGPRQEVLPVPDVRLHAEDVPGRTPAERERAARDLVDEEASIPFDLSAGPVWRARLLRLGREDHVLSLVVHHIAADGWSMGVLVRELSEGYASRLRGVSTGAPTPATQYADFAVWQRRWLEDGELDRQLEFWRGELDAVPVLELPTDHPRPPHPSYRGIVVDVDLGNRLSEAVRRLARERGATPHHVLMTAFAAMLHRWTRQDDFAVGTPVAGRRREETENLIGFFVNTLAVRLRPGRGSFEELVDEVRDRMLALDAHQDAPFERIVEEIAPERDTSRNPIFQTMFALHNVPLGPLHLGDLRIDSFEFGRASAQFDLEMSLFDAALGFSGRLHAARDLFEPETVEHFRDQFVQLLEAAVRTPGRRLKALPLSEPSVEAETERRLEGPAPTDDRPLDLARLFEEAVDRNPDAPALLVDGVTTSYEDLEREANRFASALKARGVRRGDRIGLSLARGRTATALLLGIRKAGAAYVPLDPSYPESRRNGMAADAGLRLLVVDSAAPPGAAGTPPVVGAEALLAEAAPAAGRLRLRSHEDDVVYVVFTSGSTGRPKGIAMRQGALATLIGWQRSRSTLEPGSRTLQFASLSFDVHFQEIFSTLAAGGTLVPVDEATRRDPVALRETLSRHSIQRVFLPFVALEAMVDTDGPPPASLREVVTAGERLRITPALRRFFGALPAATLDNQYGPSETHVVTAHRLEGPPDTWPDLPPIGRPVAGTHLHIVEPDLTPAPRGAVGELLVGGASLARGYEGRPELTAERFVPDPTRPGRRVYRTGDLVRLRPDGTLDFHGRSDRQVKVRGFRIEPAEVESVLSRHADVRAAVVDTRPGPGAAPQLVAWIVAAEGGDLNAVRELAARELPEPMVPTAWVAIDDLPRTPSGKIDRDRLPAPAAADEPDGADDAPRTEAERTVADAFRAVLECGPVGRSSHFFRHGGHSLLATRLVARLRRRSGVEVPLRAVFERPTVEGLARCLEGTIGTTPGSEPIPRADLAGLSPLSYQQERLWFLHRLDPLGTGFHVSVGVELEGDLHESALIAALRALVRRHEALRTRFVEKDGVPRQVVDEAVDLPLHCIDVTEEADPRAALEAALEENRSIPFDVAAGPLWRAALVRIGPRRHALLLTLHHLVTDGWSMSILVRELGEEYEAGRPSRPEASSLTIRYRDYAVWQREWLAGGELERQLGYWRESLRDVAPLELPTDRPRPPALDGRGRRVRCELDAETTSRIRSFLAEADVTLHMLLLAAYSLVLSRWSGQDDFAVGVPVANRTREETEDLLGYFVNTLAIRVRVGPDGSRRGLLDHVRDASLAAFSHQDVPFESLLEELRPPRDLSRSPVFQVWFNLVNVPEEEARFGPLQVRPLGVAANESRFDLSLYGFETGDTLLLDLIGAEVLFKEARLNEFLDQVVLALDALIREPDGLTADVSLRTPDAESRLPDASAALSDAWRGSVPELVSRRAGENPGAIAVTSQSGSWTYAELEARKNRVARALAEAGVERGAAVAVIAHRSAPTVLAVLGVLESGGATVVLDPSHPPARLVACLEEADVRAVLHVAAAGAIPGPVESFVRQRSLPVLVLESEPALLDERLARFADAPLSYDLAPDDLACITFTSGSTGRPKAVRGAHGPLTHFQPTLEERFALGPDDVFSMLSGLSHDPLQRDIFTPLLLGGRIAIPSPDDVDPLRLARWVRAAGVTRLGTTPAMMRLLADDPDATTLPAVRTVFSLGEALTRRDVDRIRRACPNAEIANLYGTTETQRSVGCFVLPRDADLDHDIVPAGTGLGSAQLLVRREGGREAAPGELGEIWIRGPHLALGYADEGETAARFVGTGADRCYRTGDLGRYLLDGNVRAAGRRDGQLNVRGFRVERGEVEAALEAHPEVGDVVVAADGRGRLTAWITARAGREADPEAVLAFARQRLPAAFVPGAVVPVASVPLTPNGKIDFARLPDPDSRSPRPSAPPSTDEERAVAALFGEVLECADLGMDDDFFARGGHSLLAVRLLSRLSTTLRVDVPLRRFFDDPTPRGVVLALARARRPGEPALPPLRRVPESQRRRLSDSQSRIWFIERLEPGTAAYHLPTALALTGPLDEGALHGTLRTIERRHEALRARFPEEDDGPVQRFREPRDRVLETVDLSSADDPESRLRERLRDEATRPFDLSAGPLWRATLFRITPERSVLSVVFHHLVSDGRSSEVLHEELVELYEAFRTGRPDPLPAPEFQYADWAGWQRSWLDDGEQDRQLRAWTETLRDVAPLELPTDRPRPARRRLRGASRPLPLGAIDAAALTDLARGESATLFQLLLAGFQATLSRFSGQRDLVVGTPIANRRGTESQSIVGFFANTVALRGRWSADATFRDLVRHAREITAHALAHQDVPFEAVVDALAPPRDLSRQPIFDVMFVLRRAGRETRSTGSLAVEPFAVETGSTAFDLTLVLGEDGDRIFGELEYDPDLFDPGTIDRIGAVFSATLREAIRNPDERLEDLELRAPAERALVAGTNATGSSVTSRTLHSLVEEHARRSPDAIAVEDEDEELTYRSLDEAAEAVAAALQEAGISPEDAVGVVASRNVRAIVAMVGVWKAGGVYVPVDPSQPRPRLESMLRDARVRVLLAEPGRDAAFPGLPVLPLSRSDASPRRRRPPRVPPGQAAYVIFTSGSSGAPKGPVVEHDRAATRALDTARAEGIRSGDRCLQFFPLSFDGSLLEILPALAQGATIVLHPDPRGETPDGLLQRLRSRSIDVVHLPVGFFHELAHSPSLAERSPGRLRLLATGGEAPRADSVAAFHRATNGSVDYRNLYGPTEGIILCTEEAVPLSEASADLVALGRPMANTRIHLLNARGRPVPVGAIGEIHLGGPLLARGYVDRPELTADAFRPDPFSPDPGARLYRTGDLARRLPDGRLVHLGRRDAQVKIRGFRVELGEVESALRDAPGVREVVAHSVGRGAGARIIAYWTARDEGASESALRARALERLPAVMIPSAFVRLPELPRTSSGKIDRRALPAPSPESRDGRRPQSPSERRLAALWGDVLQREDVRADEGFFEVGGNSLLAIRLVSAVRREFGIELPVAVVFRQPTLSGLARILDGEETARAPETRVPAFTPLRSGSGPPIYAFPAVGGGVSDFAELAAAVQDDRPVRVASAFALPDSASIEDEASAWAEAVVAEAPRGAVQLIGWSYGALIAAETAMRLRSAGLVVHPPILLDAPAPGADSPLPSEALLGDADVPAHELDAWRERIRRRLEARRRHQPVRRPGDLFLVRGTESTAVRGSDPTLGWSSLAEGDVHVEWVAGSHESLLAGEGARAVAALLDRIARSPFPRSS